MELVVGRIGRAHGIRGEVSVDVRTDDPDLRFAEGAVLATDRAGAAALTVVRTRPHHGRLLVLFEHVEDRTAADALRGVLLLVDSTDAPPLEDPDEFYDHELVGLAVVTVGGAAVGEVGDVLHPPGPALLVVQRPDGGETLVPFVRAMVPVVDVAGGQVVIDPPPGLLELAHELTQE